MKIFFLLFFVSYLLTRSISAEMLFEQGANDSLWYKNNFNYSLQLGYYDAYKTKQADIVMLGNSITHGANWNELLARPNVVERGIPSDIIEGFLHRMDYVYKLRPKICFIMGGVNDIYSWIPVETILQNYLEVINGLKARNIKVVIQSTLHTSPDWGKEWLSANRPDLDIREYNEGRNQEINRLNQLLSSYAKKNGIDFIDLNRSMAQGNFIKSDLTWDGTHLNGKGYKIWAQKIEGILSKYGL